MVPVRGHTASDAHAAPMTLIPGPLATLPLPLDVSFMDPGAPRKSQRGLVVFCLILAFGMSSPPEGRRMRSGPDCRSAGSRSARNTTGSRS